MTGWGRTGQAGVEWGGVEQRQGISVLVLCSLPPWVCLGERGQNGREMGGNGQGGAGQSD